MIFMTLLRRATDASCISLEGLSDVWYGRKEMNPRNFARRRARSSTEENRCFSSWKESQVQSGNILQKATTCLYRKLINGIPVAPYRHPLPPLPPQRTQKDAGWTPHPDGGAAGTGYPAGAGSSGSWEPRQTIRETKSCKFRKKTKNTLFHYLSQIFLRLFNIWSVKYCDFSYVFFFFFYSFTHYSIQA